LFTVFYWFPFLFNNPLNFPLVNTLDAKHTKPAGVCTTFDWDAAKSNILLWFFVWWVPHSALSRRVVKQALGLYNHPLDRPLFGTFACLGIATWTHLWQPVSDCQKWDPFSTSLLRWAISAPIMGFALFLILNFFWTMPDHVFGTSRHICNPNAKPHGIFTKFPYGMVRHPAAAGFLWLFWSIPSWTTNHLLYATLWSIFIVVGTSFEEGGLRSDTGEFGRSYCKYADQVGMFFPKPRWFLGKEVKV